MDPTTAASRQAVTSVDVLPLPAWTCDRRGRILHANDRWAAYLGGESHHRRHWLTDRFIHPHDIAAVRSSWHRALTTEVEFDVLARLRRFDDSWRWHVLRATPVVEPDDATTIWTGAWVDVHEHFADLEHLRLRERMLSAQGEASLDAKILVSPDRRLIWANRRAYDMWGVTREEYPIGSDLGVAARQLEHRVVDSARNRATLDAMYDDPDRVIRDEVQLTDGRTMERYSTPVVDPDGTIIGRMNTYRDVTVTRRMISDLHERAEAALVLTYVADAVILVDSDEVVHLWNPAAALLTGITEQDALNRRLTDLLVDWEPTRDLIPILESVDEPRTAATVPLEVGGGREAWISAVGVRFENGVVYAIRDVSDVQRLERMRSGIVATVSHELRTPLTSIYGMAITLQHDEQRLEDDTRQRLLATIVEQSARLGSILDDILVANGLEAGSVTVRPSVLDVTDVVHAAVDVARATTGSPGRVIDVQVDDDIPLVAVDPARTEQALVNLLENAIKYSPGGGSVDVHVRMASSAEVAIDVIDHGLGIPSEELDNVFEKFHRLDPSMTLGIAGTGLGLYIARELVRRMGGDVTVTSMEGVGSTFTMLVPVA